VKTKIIIIFSSFSLYIIYIATKEIIKVEEVEQNKERRKRAQMEWKKWYLDAILVPLALMMMICYHIYLSFMVRTNPFSTLLGINSHGRRIWISAMIKVFHNHRHCILLIKNVTVL